MIPRMSDGTIVHRRIGRPAWSDAQYFHDFLVRNQRSGPVAAEIPYRSWRWGILATLHNGTEYYHTLIVTGFSNGEPLVCAHTEDAYMRPLQTYLHSTKQGLHIVGINRWRKRQTIRVETMSKPCGLPDKAGRDQEKTKAIPLPKIPEGDDLSLKFNSRRKEKKQRVSAEKSR